MQLLVACGVNANDRVLPLAWALVLIKNKKWWTWFCLCMRQAFDIDIKDDFVFMSNREKGLDLAVEEVFPKAKHSYCC
jgi:hypothetical protein